jgi:hypothetical protein
MEPYTITNDITVFGIEVPQFPSGIDEVFDKLVKKLPGGFNRSFYGVCEMKNGVYVYKAAAEEIIAGEAEKYNCERFTIEKGKYLTVPLKDWRKKTDKIKDIFQQLMTDGRVNKSKPSVEWYKNEAEMLCMVKTI